MTCSGYDKPEILLVAKWKKHLNVLSFMVNGEKYCDSVVYASNPVVQHPGIAPHVVLDGLEFLDWDAVDGTEIIGGMDILDQNGNVVCAYSGHDDGNDVVD